MLELRTPSSLREELQFRHLAICLAKRVTYEIEKDGDPVILVAE